MATHVFNEFKRASAAGEIDLNADDIRCALLMSNTTVDTENDGIVNVDDFTTLDECDGSGYGRQALATETVTKDDANDRASFDADDPTFSALGASTRDVVGALIYKHVGADSANIPICWLEFSSPVTPDGSDLRVAFNAAGIMTLT